jgi:hypothetical protein
MDWDYTYLTYKNAFVVDSNQSNPLNVIHEDSLTSSNWADLFLKSLTRSRITYLHT